MNLPVSTPPPEPGGRDNIDAVSVSSGRDGNDPLWDRRFYWLLGLGFIVRVLFLATNPLDLAPDEAYYWDWSRRPDWGYFSKPPLIAWLNALSTRLLGATEFTLRLPAALLTTLAGWTLFAWARRLYDSRTAFWAAAALSATPAAAALGALMTVDAPLIFFWVFALYLFWRALETEDRPGLFWLGSGLTVGLGLLSKQTMLAFPFLAGVFLLLGPGLRRHFKGPWPYLALTIALLPMAPILWWNQQHHWVTFFHTAHHFHQSLRTITLDPLGFAEFVGGQLLIITPRLWLLAVIVGGSLLMLKTTRRDTKKLLLTIFGILPLLAVTLLSLRQHVQPNWPAVFYPAGIVLVSAWACGRVSAGRRLDRWRRLFFPGLAIAAVFTLVTYSLPYIFSIPGLAGGRFDITARLRGWRQLGLETSRILAGLPRREKTFIIAYKRQDVSELAFYVAGRPRVYQWRDEKRRTLSQYHVWEGPVDKTGWDALLVIRSSRRPHPDLVATFKSFRPLGGIYRPAKSPVKRKYRVYHGRWLKKWPR